MYCPGTFLHQRDLSTKNVLCLLWNFTLEPVNGMNDPAMNKPSRAHTIELYYPKHTHAKKHTRGPYSAQGECVVVEWSMALLIVRKNTGNQQIPGSTTAWTRSDKKF